jgi:hypothetical protein
VAFYLAPQQSNWNLLLAKLFIRRHRFARSGCYKRLPPILLASMPATGHTRGMCQLWVAGFEGLAIF